MIHIVSHNPVSFPLALFSADALLTPYIWVFYAAFIIAFVFTPIMRSVAMYYGVIDHPDQLRKLHSEPVAYLGGAAVFLGWISGLAISHFTSMHSGNVVGVPVPVSVVIGGFIIVILGLWDDLRKVKPRYKIAGQVLAALVLLCGQVGTDCTRPLLAPVAARLLAWFGIAMPDWVFLLTGALLTIGLIVFCCNAANLMDGLDGLCGGVTAVIAGGLLFLAIHLGMLTGEDEVERVAIIVVLSLALLGSVLGFIPFNFNPASIFLGDTGSMFLGFACATLIILMAQADTRWLLAALVMFALPVLDTSLAFARRYVNKRPFFSADRHHFHHQLVARGLTIRKTVVVSYVLSIGFVLLGSTIVFMRTRFAIAIYLVVFGSIIVTAYKMGMVHEKRGGKRSD